MRKMGPEGDVEQGWETEEVECHKDTQGPRRARKELHRNAALFLCAQ